ncbi:MAG: FapA family protein [bacterium]
MTETKEKQTPESFGEALTGAVITLATGVDGLIRELRKSPELKKSHAINDFEGVGGFLRTLELVGDTMPQERLREAVRNTVKSIHKSFEQLPRNAVAKIPGIKIDRSSGRLDFLCQVVRLLGPDIRIAGNEMAAWIRLDPDEKSFFTPESVIESLQQRGIVFGIDEEEIRNAFTSSTPGVEVCAAKGQVPVQGQDGSIEYKVNVEDLGRIPKIMEAGRASFKDLELFTYVAAGDVLAVKIPQTPGTPGSTVTGRKIQSLESEEAEFPECKNTRISDDNKYLLATLDGAVSKRAGMLVLEPSLRVATDVSYETGNIDSKVLVSVAGDIRSGFPCAATETFVSIPSWKALCWNRRRI